MPRLQTAWGIDVGTTALKAMKIRRDGEKIYLEAMEVIEHSRFLSEADADRKEIVRESLAKFLERHPLRGERVFIGAAGSTSFARFVKLPPVEPRKIPEIVRFEAMQQIPFPLDQVIWDFHKFQSAESPEVEVGIFAIKTDLVSQILADFRNLGITVHGVQIAPLAVYNALAYEGVGRDKGTIVIDVGADHTDLIIIDQGRLWLRNINLGGNSFTESLARSFRFPFPKAETLKKNAATSKWARQIFQAMRPTFAELVAEMQRSVGYYNGSHRDSRLERILGLGNPFRLAILQKYIHQYMTIDTRRLEGFNRLESLDTRLTAGLGDRVLGLTTAYGLALQALGMASINSNLLPVSVARETLWRRKYPWFAATAAAFVVGAAVAGARCWMDSAAFHAALPRSGISNLSAQLNEAAQWRDEYNSLNNTYRRSLRKAQFYLALNKSRNVWPAILQTFYAALPQASRRAAGRGPDWKIVIQSMRSVYASNLTAANPNQPAAPGAPPLNGAPASAPPAGEGFRVFVTGYTPWKHPLRIIEHFRDALKRTAPLKSNKPFYIVIPPNSLAYMRIAQMRGHRSAGKSDVGFVAWGSHPGPFAKVFMPDFLPPRLRRPYRATGESNFNSGRSGAGSFGRGTGGGLKNMIIDPNSGKSLKNATAFRLTFLIYLRKETVRR